jgi:hypothetical protein
MAEYNFALSGVTLPGTEDLFGIWTVPTPAEVSFDMQAAEAPDEPTWRIQLPAPLADAQAILNAQSQTLQRSESDLFSAERRLAQLGLSYEAGEAGVAFAALPAPEADLLATLSRIESPISFEVSGAKERAQQETSSQWRVFVEQVRHMVSHYARVETEVGGTLVGYTAVGWTGDFDTVWEADVAADSMGLHHQSVQLALGSRLALIRLLTIVGAGATKLALRLTIPGAQLLVLPAAWKFVRDVLEELRRSWPELQHLVE